MTEREKQLYVMAIKAIGDLVMGLQTKELWMEDRRDETPNPCWNQTKQGLVLEQYYGLPSTLWTPWGKKYIGGSGSGHWDRVMPILHDRLGLQLHLAEYHTEMGCYGPYWKITKVDDLSLPELVLKKAEDFTPYKETIGEWGRLICV